MTEIVKKWKITSTLIGGYDKYGNVYVQCVDCNNTMSQTDFKIVHGKKKITHVCNKCGKKKVL